jgi:hypothetical protein
VDKVILVPSGAVNLLTPRTIVFFFADKRSVGLSPGYTACVFVRNRVGGKRPEYQSLVGTFASIFRLFSRSQHNTQFYLRGNNS